MSTKTINPKARPEKLLNSKNVPAAKRTPVFPHRLYDMLDNANDLGYSHIVSWMPDGKAFKIHNDKALVNILKTYFKQTRLKSFLRQLQLYGFARTFKGPRRGECKHELFLRGKRDLLHLRAIDDFKVTPPVLSTVVRCVSSDSTHFSLCTSSETSKEVDRHDFSMWPVIPTKLSNLVVNDRVRKIAEHATASLNVTNSFVDEIISVPAKHTAESAQLLDDLSSLDDIDGTDSITGVQDTASAVANDNWTDGYSMITVVKGDILSSMRVHPIEDSNMAFFEKHFIYNEVDEDTTSAGKNEFDCRAKVTTYFPV